jgi:hypothetical protein
MQTDGKKNMLARNTDRQMEKRSDRQMARITASHTDR